MRPPASLRVAGLTQTERTDTDSLQPGAATELFLEPTSLVHALHDDPLVISLPQGPAPQPANGTHSGTCHRASSRSADRQEIQGSRLPAHAAAAGPAAPQAPSNSFAHSRCSRRARIPMPLICSERFCSASHYSAQSGEALLHEAPLEALAGRSSPRRGHALQSPARRSSP